MSFKNIKEYMIYKNEGDTIAETYMSYILEQPNKGRFYIECFPSVLKEHGYVS